jgi:hypothetical protein
MPTKTKTKSTHSSSVAHARTERPAMSTKSHVQKPVSATSTKGRRHRPVSATSAKSANQEESLTMTTTQPIGSKPPIKTGEAPLASAPGPAAAAAPAPAPVAFVEGPPSSVSIPLMEYAAASPGEFKNVVPRVSERAALAQALKDLRAFTTYQQTLGTSAPAYGEVVQAFTVGSQWTSMRALASSWDGYSVLQEGFAWRAIRLLMAQLVPVFTLAATANPKLLTQYPGLASLLGAKKSIARKSASTKKLNKKAISEGKDPVHGTVGKRWLRKAEKAASAAGQAAGATAPAATVPTTQPVAVQEAAPPVVTAAPVVAASVNAAGSGAAH